MMRKKIILVGSLLLIILGRFIPSSLTMSQMAVITTFAGVLVLWLFFGIDWPSLIGLAALCFIPELGTNAVLSASFGNNTFAFLLFTFLCTYALSKTSIIKRVALWFVNTKIAQKGPWPFSILFFMSIIVTGLVISPTVLFMVYIPIIEEIYEVLGLKKGDKMASMLMMGLVFTCAISSGMTPIAHVFPLLAMGVYESVFGVAISYAEFMMVAIPVGLICTLLMILMFRFIYRPEMKEIKSLNKIEEKMPRNEKIILLIFGFVIIWWVIPGFMKNVLSEGALLSLMTYLDSFTTALPPLVGAILLCLINVDDKPLLDLKEALSKGVSWTSLIMCACTLAMSSALTNGSIGITAVISETMSVLLSNISPLIFILIITTWAGLQTNLSSNMVTSTLVSSVCMAILAENQIVSPMIMTILIGILASYAFATPPAMPSVSIAGSSGWTTPKNLMVYGFLLMMISIIISSFVGYPLGLWV